MTAKALSLLAALPLLAGCPIDQPLPTVGGPFLLPPPRIVFELVSPQETTIDVSKTCPTTPTFTFKATLADENREEQVEARWFVDYLVPGNTGVQAFDNPQPSANAEDILRPVRDFLWTPGDYGTFAAPVHVVELVASNAFYALGTTGLPLPNRTPTPGGETQVFRWVLRYVDTGGRCG